jgi:hypothetical protein
MSHQPEDEQDEDRYLQYASRKRRGWAGEEMELHRPSEGIASELVAVDLEQFRNTQVGVGYQAKHVIRQPTAAPISIQETKAKLPTAKETVESQAKKRRSDEREQRYLQCDALRRFRKELEKLLALG